MMHVEVEWIGDDVAARIVGAVPAALNHAAEMLMTWSREAAPIRDGALRGSGQVTPASDSNPIAHVSFDTVYAWRQHEELDWYHPRGGGPKYLEGPLMERAQELTDAIASRLGSVI